MAIVEGFPTYPRPGVLTRSDDPEFGEGIAGAFSQGDQINILYSDNDIEAFPATDIQVDSATGRLTFNSDGDVYTVREPREDDGLWLSRYRLFLPLEAVEALLEIGGNEVAVADDINAGNETLDAYASEESVYILGVVYTNNAGRWLRTDGDWLHLSPNDETFNDMMVMSIDPERAQEFVDLYDRNYVTITEAEEYELDGATADEE